MEFPLGYREVVPDQTLAEKWKEITLNTGGSQSTLQDIRVPEKAGGYAYKYVSNHITRNRFIYWRINNDVLELVEQSLDVNLSNCRVRYKFMDTPILDGISIHETSDSVIILVVTVYSVHKLVFPHPNVLHRQSDALDYNPDSSEQSIFSEASVQAAKDPYTFHVIQPAGTNSPVPHAASSWLNLTQEEVIFALAYNSGTILLLKFNLNLNLVQTHELKQDSSKPRFLSAITTAFRRNNEANVAMSLSIHSFAEQTFLFALYRDGVIRMWSCHKGQSVAHFDAVRNQQEASQGIQGHVLRKSLGSDDEFYIGTYMKFEFDCEFCILRPYFDGRTWEFQKVKSLVAQDQHLVDFSFTPTRLWAVWRTVDLDTVALTHARLSLDSSSKDSTCFNWENAILEPLPDRDYVAYDQGTDPRQAYINYIFHPGQFSLHDITRALGIYQRSLVAPTSDVALSPSVLKERVCMVVEAEIQNEVMDYELPDDEYLEITNRCWSKFYSCVALYHLNGAKPLGILLLENVYGAVLLKKQTLSFLRPMEALEQMLLANDRCDPMRFGTSPVLGENMGICEDMVALLGALAEIENRMPDEGKSLVERMLYQLRSPDIVVGEVVERMLAEGDESLFGKDFRSVVFQKLENVKNITATMSVLLQNLSYDQEQSEFMDCQEDELENSRFLANVNRLFSSQLGVSVISQSVSQLVDLRFSVCRNMLILQEMMHRGTEIFDINFMDAIKTDSMPQTATLMQSYYVMKWICESNASYASTQTLLENSSVRLGLLKLTQSRATFGQRDQRSLTLLEMFVQNGGSAQAHKLMARTIVDPNSLVLWHNGMLGHMAYVAKLIWPISDNFIFSEWLLSSCQFLLIQEYARLLKTWCHWNSASRDFILAIALLEMGEPQKAMDKFAHCAKGVLTEPFIVNIVLTPNENSEEAAFVLYYLKIIELLEQHGAWDCMIKIAETAISRAAKDDPNLPTLHSIIFNQHLKLGHHSEAYHCLIQNPDKARKLDCLRQLVVTLFERKKLNDLVKFPYIEMYDSLVNIVASRARSIDIMENNHYDFLYSFHVDKGNYRKAAAVMYEQAMRFRQENSSVPMITRQADCLLTCINALQLVNKNYKWIVRPTFEETFQYEKDPKMKRSFEGEQILHYKVKEKLDVLELEDIRKEYAIVLAKIKISKHTSETQTVTQAGVLELISMLANIGLYLDALKLCDQFEISKKCVLENLASQCARMSLQEDPNVWDWLALNDISEISVTATSVTVIAWRLLEKLTLEHEKENESTLHKAVAEKLFQHGAFLPHTLYASYRKRNAAELLRSMLNVGRLVEATDLAVEYISAASGKGMENFNLKTALSAITPPIWLPINILEWLLLELKHASKTDSMYKEHHDKLNSALLKHLKLASEISEQMMKYQSENFRRQSLIH